MGILDKFKKKKIEVDEPLSVKSDDSLDRVTDRLLARMAEGTLRWQRRSLYTKHTENELFTAYYATLSDVKVRPQEVTHMFSRFVEMRYPDKLFEYDPLDELDMDGFTMRSYSGIFISALIQKAYSDGHNGFVIETHNRHSDPINVGRFIKGTKDNPIRVAFRGEVADLAGANTEHVAFHFNARTGNDCGRGAKHAHFVFDSKCGRGCAENAKDSTFIFNGSVEQYCARFAVRSYFEFNDAIGYDCATGVRKCELQFNLPRGMVAGSGAWRSTFYSPDESFLEHVRDVAIPGCTLYRVDTHGNTVPHGAFTKLRDFFK